MSFNLPHSRGHRTGENATVNENESRAARQRELGYQPRPSFTDVKTSRFLAEFDKVNLVDPTDGAFSVDLPRIGQSSRQLILKNWSSSTNTVTLEPAGSDEIDGAATDTISTAWGVLTIASNPKLKSWVVL